MHPHNLLHVPADQRPPAVDDATVIGVTSDPFVPVSAVYSWTAIDQAASVERMARESYAASIADQEAARVE